MQLTGELPRQHGDDAWLRLLRAYALVHLLHRCVAARCNRGVMGSHLHDCKYGLPFPVQLGEPRLKEGGQRVTFPRRAEEDVRVPLTCMALVVALGCHVQIEPLTSAA